MQTNSVVPGGIRCRMFLGLLGLSILSLLVVLDGCMGESAIITTVVNKSDVPVEAFINGHPITVVRPSETLKSPVSAAVLPGSGYAGEPTAPPPNYTVTGYEFVVGMGNIIGWVEDGKVVEGGPGELVYSATYSWAEIKNMNFTFTIARNVVPGTEAPRRSP